MIDIADDAILLDICFSTGARAADAYYIAAAKITSAVLVGNDRRQVASARRYGVNAYYLLEEHEELFKQL
ncbi:hypothetical protein PABY_13980 [Pyrodictium abyssi]|uniref:PIN domain-containing protein n=1 Tax=Pyrodictium abyssi TaxID=54256 RepID=A0ABM8IYV7_9CREN|nr:hypothetical protein PABY_13980 [Pyrodictium abyssi]